MGGLNDQLCCYHGGLELVFSLVGPWCCDDDGDELDHNGDHDVDGDDDDDDDDDDDENLDVHGDGDDGNNADECGANGEDIFWLGSGGADGADGGDADDGIDGVFVVDDGDVPFYHCGADDADDDDDNDVEWNDYDDDGGGGNERSFDATFRGDLQLLLCLKRQKAR